MEKSAQKAVVTGGAGFIGSHIAKELARRGFSVVAIDKMAGGDRSRLEGAEGVHLVEADIRDIEALRDIFKGARCVFHCAALPRVQYSIENPIETNDVNIGGTVSVLEAARKSGVGRVVYAASSSAYGDQQTLPLHEDTPAQPKSPYGLQKYVGELKCRVWNEIHGLPTVSLRYFNVYGPGFDPEGEYALVIGKFLKQKSEGKPMTIAGDGEQTRDFTHVSDIVRANIAAMESDAVGAGEVINIGAGNNKTVNRIAELIGGPTTTIPPRIEPRHTRADTTRAKELLGWEPSISIEEGIEELKRIYLP